MIMKRHPTNIRPVRKMTSWSEIVENLDCPQFKPSISTGPWRSRYLWKNKDRWSEKGLLIICDQLNLVNPEENQVSLKEVQFVLLQT